MDTRADSGDHRASESSRGCAAGYMPGLNVLCGIAEYNTQSGQPVTRHLEVEITPQRLER